jgi:hypothetical protein
MDGNSLYDSAFDALKFRRGLWTAMESVAKLFVPVIDTHALFRENTIWRQPARFGGSQVDCRFINPLQNLKIISDLFRHLQME